MPVRTTHAVARNGSTLALIALAGAMLSLPVSPGVAAVPTDAVIGERDGRNIDLDRYRGRWVLINYWATWRGACIEEMPILARLAANTGVAVIGLSDERIQPAAWAAFLAAHPVPYPVALVDRTALPDRIAPAAFIEMRPISYLIRPDGRVARRFIGIIDAVALKTALSETR